VAVAVAEAVAVGVAVAVAVAVATEQTLPAHNEGVSSVPLSLANSHQSG
jgi:hypothetical protein